MEDGNQKTKQRAFQLYNSCINSSFLVCLFIMAEYSSMLDPVGNTLQGVEQNLMTVRNQLTSLTTFFKQHRDIADVTFNKLWEKIENCSADLNIELRTPRVTKKQTCR